MNHKCNGHFFSASTRGEENYFYRCLGNGKSIGRNGLQNGEQCPECDRVIDGYEIGHIETRVVVIVRGTIPNIGEVTIDRHDV